MKAGWVNRQFFLFLITGGTAAGVNFVSRMVFNQWVSFSTAVVLAYGMGMVTAFLLARAFVFTQSEQTVGRSAAWFFLINLVAVAQTWLVSMGLLLYGLPVLGIVQFAPELAHAAGVIVPVFTSYWGHKHFSFKSSHV